MKKILFLSAFVLSVLLASCNKAPVPEPVNPFAGKQCVTIGVGEVGQTSAVLNGYFDPTDTVGVKLIYYIFLVADEEKNACADSVIAGVPGIIPFFPQERGVEIVVPDVNHRLSAKMEDLNPGSTYYCRAVCYLIYRDKEPGFGFISAENVVSFTTNEVHATVTTQDVAAPGAFGAMLTAALDTDAAGFEIETGFIYKAGESTLEDLIATGTTVKATLSDAEGSLSFSAELKNLNYASTYSFVAFSNLAGLEVYGQVKRFTTTDLDLSVTTLEASPRPVSATLKGSVSPGIRGASNPELWFLLGPEGSTLESLKSSGKKIKATIGDDFTTFSADTSLLNMTTTYCYAAAAKIADKEAFGTVRSFATTPRSVPTGAVEMGLSVLWADRNLGASSPEGIGDYYCWGEVETKSEYSLSTYKWCRGSTSGANGFTKYNGSEVWGPVVDNKTRLEPADDAATVALGAPWRIATKAEWQELIDHCDWEMNEEFVCKVTSRITGASIYLVSVGYRSHSVPTPGNNGAYLSSEKEPSGFTCRALWMRENIAIDNAFRYYGMQVRPVRE